VPDLTKIRSYVGFEPNVSLDEILQETVEHVCERTGMAALRRTPGVLEEVRVAPRRAVQPQGQAIPSTAR